MGGPGSPVRASEEDVQHGEIGVECIGSCEGGCWLRYPRILTVGANSSDLRCIRCQVREACMRCLPGRIIFLFSHLHTYNGTPTYFWIAFAKFSRRLIGFQPFKFMKGAAEPLCSLLLPKASHHWMSTFSVLESSMYSLHFGSRLQYFGRPDEDISGRRLNSCVFLSPKKNMVRHVSRHVSSNSQL